jgi:hypothetical protein
MQRTKILNAHKIGPAKRARGQGQTACRRPPSLISSPRGEQTRPSPEPRGREKKTLALPGARFKQSNRPLPPHSSPVSAHHALLFARAQQTQPRSHHAWPRASPSRADGRAHAETAPLAAPQAPSGRPPRAVALRVLDGSLTSPRRIASRCGSTAACR